MRYAAYKGYENLHKNPIILLKTLLVTGLVLGLVAAAGAAMELALKPATMPHDDTDPPGGYSGHTPYPDNLTGCQYLSVRGALTPRRDRQGRPVCIDS